MIMVSQHEKRVLGRESIEQSTEPRERAWTATGEVSREQEQIRPCLGQQLDRVADTTIWRDHTHVNIAQVTEPHTIVLGLEIGDPYRPLSQRNIGIEADHATSSLAGAERSRRHLQMMRTIDSRASRR